MDIGQLWLNPQKVTSEEYAVSVYKRTGSESAEYLTTFRGISKGTIDKLTHYIELLGGV